MVSSTVGVWVDVGESGWGEGEGRNEKGEVGRGGGKRMEREEWGGGIGYHETFSFMMLLPAMYFGDRFFFSRKGGIGGGGWLHPKVANSMAVSGLVSISNLVGTGRAIFCPFGINGMELETSNLTL